MMKLYSSSVKYGEGKEKIMKSPFLKNAQSSFFKKPAQSLFRIRGIIFFKGGIMEQLKKITPPIHYIQIILIQSPIRVEPFSTLCERMPGNPPASLLCSQYSKNETATVMLCIFILKPSVTPSTNEAFILKSYRR